jgi:predicted Zn-dependent peptidase
LLQKVIETGITEEELAAAKKTFFNQLLSMTGSKFMNLICLMSIEDYGFSTDHYEASWQKAKNLTVEDVNSAIKKHYKLGDMVRIRVGNFAGKVTTA